MKNLHQVHILILIGVIFIAAFLFVGNFVLQNSYDNRPVTLGVSFSPDYAIQLGLDPKKTYQEILQDLSPQKIRLAAYWDKIEPTEGKYDFTELDDYINQAGQSGSKVVLAIGYKLPRWPECRFPGWLNSKDTSLRQQKELDMLEEVVNHYNQNPAIDVFQLENEPLLPFGECPKPDPNFLKKEVHLVKSLTQKNVLLTDSGELQSWIVPMQNSDVFGTTIYRKINDPQFGDLYYPFPAWSYRLKSNLIRTFFAPSNKKTIISELQGEPWTNVDIQKIPIQDQAKSFTIRQLESGVNYARNTGFSEVYLWGVEWWYYMAGQGHPEYLDYVKKIF